MKQNRFRTGEPTSRFGGFSHARSPRSWRRVLALLPALLALLACAPKHRPVPKVERIMIPRDCVLGFEAERSQCREERGVVICDGVVVKLGCVKVQP